MNVLHIAPTAWRGGAAMSLRLLHRLLREAGHGSRLLTLCGGALPPEEEQTFPALPLWARLPYHGLNFLGLNYAGIPTTARLGRHPWFQWADVIHYHNLHGGFFNYLALPFLTAKKPAVWTLRDMWALTGHCAYSLDCERWRTGCGRCPYPGIYPRIRRDATRWEWRLKQAGYRRSCLLVTAPSRWLTELARQSILGCQPIRQVPNAVDTTVFQPLDKAILRARLGWPQEATVLLYAVDAAQNIYKGFDLLPAALAGLSPERRSRLFLALLGEGTTAVEGIRTQVLGLCPDEKQIARFYAAADILVFPTLADNQPRVLLEAMACGCPCVASGVGGVPELVVTGQTGYLARPGDAEDLRRGMEYLLDQPESRLRMGRQARQWMEERHSCLRHLQNMLAAYEAAIQRWRLLNAPRGTA